MSLKTKYKYIEFCPNELEGKKKVWTMIDRKSKRGALGVCQYSSYYHQWTIDSLCPIYEMTAHYLHDIAYFLDELNKKGST